MDIHKIKLLLNTIKYLKPIQVYYRLYYFLWKRIFNWKSKEKRLPEINSINWESKINSSTSYLPETKTFTFLNISHDFSDQIEWNYDRYGKLWTYNLNYFDFLNQASISKKNGEKLINQYINFYPRQIDGFEPYTISLRSMNWIKFLCKNKINDHRINKFLFRDCNFLFNNLEYHLLGNHLLENAFSLLFSSYYFQNYKFYNKSKALLFEQLDEQILKDGGHFELSPMYHNLILQRVLDCINLIKSNPDFKSSELLEFLFKKAGMMCCWLNNIIYDSGLIPMVNDSAHGITINANKLIDYAKMSGVKEIKIPLSQSGYRKINNSNYELFIDIGNIGPDYQPGHAHSDTFNFELHVNKFPIIVDTGISTYEKNELRQHQRSTKSHNTVMIRDFEQSELWAGFRVARRAKVFDIFSGENQISAKHNGYKRMGYIHSRSFSWFKKEIIIQDKLRKSSQGAAKAMFHFHSDVKKPKIDANKVILNDHNISILFSGHSDINIFSYDLCQGFNKTIKAYKIVVNFDKELKTKINL